jgi:hypothetical protein
LFSLINGEAECFAIFALWIYCGMRRWIILSLVFISCKQHSNKSISFYYWKTQFHLNEYEKETLTRNGVNTLYVRYCDVDIDGPVAPVSFDSTARGYNIIPVVYIKNRVFEKINPDTLAENVFNFIKAGEVQFDCDWTEKTKENYFRFIRSFKNFSKQRVSCTIRLHQVKYPGRTGIPPVDYGVLMYYNMGSISAGPQSSIYERSIASKYNSFIRNYPLELDVALPVFSWGLKIREGRVVELLNKIYFAHFKNDSNFRYVKNNWFITTNACFKAGYYFAKDDMVKIEQVPAADLLQMAEDVNRNSNQKIRNILFYDLDSSNLAQYEKDIFQKVLGRFN